MNWRLQWYLIVPFIVAVVLVSALATSLGVAQASRSLEDTLIDKQEKSSAATANAVANYLSNTNESLAAAAALIAESSLYPSVRSDDIHALFDPLIAYKQDFVAFYLANNAGEVKVARPGPPQGFAKPLAQHPAFAMARSTRGAALNSDITLAPAYWITPVPGSLNHAEPYFLIGLLSAPRIVEILYANKDPEVRSAVLDVRHLVVYATSPELSKAPTSAWMALEAGPEGARSLEQAAPTGEPDSILTINRLVGFPFNVVLIGDKSEIKALQGQLIRSAMTTGGALAAAAILLGLVATRTVTRPVSEVRYAANRMTKGDLEVRANPKGPRELRELAADFNQMAGSLAEERDRLVSLQRNLEVLVQQRTAEVKQKQEEMELFFYGIGHDFKSPVIAISSFSQLAEEALRNGGFNKREMRDYVDRIRRSSQTLQTLITELLQFAQAEHALPAYRETDAAQVVRSVVDEAKPFARERGVELRTSGIPVTLHTDPDRLRHILTNLLQNAIKYMPQKARPVVSVQWRKEARHLLIEVYDNGAGIPEEVQKRLFRPFSRHNRAGVGASGVGLGLSIVKRFVESLHGRIELHSRPGHGSTFIIRLPLVAPKASAA